MKNRWNTDYLLLVITNLVITVLVVFLVSSQTGLQGVPGSNGIPGSSGATGENGTDGVDGESPYIGSNGNWWIGSSDTGVSTESWVEDTFNPLDFHSNLPVDDAVEAYDLFNTANPNVIENSVAYSTTLVDQGFTAISTPQEFLAIEDNPTGNYVLVNDINFLGVTWSPILSFGGVLDGAGFGISNVNSDNLETNSSDNLALFRTLDGAVVKNLSLFDFSITFNINDAAMFEMGLLSVYANFSVIANIQIENSILEGHRNLGLVSAYADGSTFYNISINSSALNGVNVIGGVVSDSGASTFINIDVTQSNLGISNSQGGFISGHSYWGLFHDLYIHDSYIQIVYRENEGSVTKEDIGLAIGSLQGSYVDSVTISLSAINVIAPLVALPYYTIYNLGGVVGYGNVVLLSNIEVLASENVVIDIPDFDISDQNPMVEYIGGVAGYLDQYLLFSVENHADVRATSNVSSFYSSIEAVAGVLGYSAGQGTFYDVVNTGNIFGSVDVGGLLGGVGYIQNLGHITMNQVANFGMIFGGVNVGGLIGSMDGLTTLKVSHAYQNSDVFGVYHVGGLAGQLNTVNFNVDIHVELSVIRGRTFGIDVVGGLAGLIRNNNYDQAGGKISFDSIIVDNHVQSMLYGLAIDEETYIGFEDFYNGGDFYFSNQLGLVFGYVEAAIDVEKIFVHQALLEVQLFVLIAVDDQYLLDDFIYGYMLPVSNRIMNEIFVDRDLQAWYEHPVTNLLFPSFAWEKGAQGFIPHLFVGFESTFLPNESYYEAIYMYIFSFGNVNV
jgi:hypothetical protein